MLLAGVALLVVGGLLTAWSVGWLLVGVGAAVTQAGLIGAAVRGPD